MTSYLRQVQATGHTRFGTDFAML